MKSLLDLARDLSVKERGTINENMMIGLMQST
jgi:hypothetical protein